MSTVQLNKFGSHLEGRPICETYLHCILSDSQIPFELDFLGVKSIGLSFSENVIGKLAEMNGGSIKILNSNEIVNSVVREASLDKGFSYILEERSI